MDVESMGPVVGPILDMEGVKMGSSGGVVMLKQHRIKLVRGYLAPCVH